MAEENESSLALSQGANDIPPLRLGEQGFNGLYVVGGIPYEECQRELSFPQSINTFKKMAKDGTIAPALNLVEMMIARVPWEVKIPKGYEVELKDKAEFLRQCMNDMEHSWGSFIRQCVSFNRYGFSVHEKVYRKRLKSAGSKYNDGLIGLKKLPIRAQDTIVGFEWKSQGRELSGVWQAVVKPTGLEQSTYFGPYMMQDAIFGDKTLIPRKKFMLFRNGNLKDDPLGTSPLIGAYESWKYKKSLEQVEAQGIAQDIHGFKVLYIPPRYMAEDASPEDQEVYKVYQHMMRNIHVGKQSGMILPQVTDENNNEYFKFDVVNVQGSKSYDSAAIIQRYANEILTSLTADFLVLGQSGGGSYALSESKISVSETAIEAKLVEIQDQLNHDLIPQLFALNGWAVDVIPYFQFGEISKTDLDVLSKFIQRCASTGMLPKTPEVVQWICEQAGIPYSIDEDMDREEFLSMLTAYESSSGQGMEEGTAGVGTATTAVGRDTSIANSENT